MMRSFDATRTNQCRQPRPRVHLLLAISALLLGAVTCDRVAIAGDLDKVELFDIPAQSLDKALLEFGMQAHVQIMFEWSPTTDSRRSRVIKGRCTARQALSALLDGTQLTFAEYRHTVTIVRDPPRGRARTNVRANGAAQATAPDDKPQPIESKKGQTGAMLEEVTVTGTYIRGAGPVGSPLIVYSREEIEESGAANIDEFARQIPENFSGADTLTSGLGRATQLSVFSQTGQNNFGGSAFNINGIGPSATLTLLDGHRLAPAGADGSFVDVSLIPLSAVERIELLPDGASAIYGSDAVAGVVNIITRKDFQGAQTSVRYGESTEGGAREVTASQLLGKSWSSGNVMMTYEYDGNSGLDASQRDFIPGQGGPDSIEPPNWRNGVLISGNLDLGSETSLSGDAIYGTRRFHSEFTVLPTGESDLYENRSKATQSGLSLTLRRALAGDWSLDVTGFYSRIQQMSTGGEVFAFNSGFTVNETTMQSTSTSLAGGALLAQGSIFTLPGGEIKAAFGTSFEAQRLIFGAAAQGTDSVTYPAVNARRRETSVYGELGVPIIGASNARAMTRRLELSLAAREDHYSDFGGTVNPKVGVLWSPIEGLNLRASYGTSYRAPLLSQVATPVAYVAELFPDPAAAGGLTDTLYMTGGNPSLRAERSRSFTVGPDLEIDGVSASATYFHTHYVDRVGTPPIASLLTVLVDPADAPFVARNPPLATIETAFRSPGFQGDYAGFGAAGVAAIFNSQDTNLATTTQSSISLRFAYRAKTPSGIWSPAVAVDRQLENRLRASPTSSPLELLDLYGEPLRWKARGGLAWENGYYGAALNLSYVSGYRDQFTTPRSDISSWTTADLHLSYRVPDTARGQVLRGVTVALTVENITNEAPPYVEIPSAVTGGAPPIPYDPANASPVGRFVSLEVSKQWTR